MTNDEYCQRTKSRLNRLSETLLDACKRALHNALASYRVDDPAEQRLAALALG